MTPSEIRIQPNRLFRFQCKTDDPSVAPSVQFVDGRPVTNDPRFFVSRISSNELLIEAPNGLPPNTPQIVVE